MNLDRPEASGDLAQRMIESIEGHIQSMATIVIGASG